MSKNSPDPATDDATHAAFQSLLRRLDPAVDSSQYTRLTSSSVLPHPHSQVGALPYSTTYDQRFQRREEIIRQTGGLGSSHHRSQLTPGAAPQIDPFNTAFNLSSSRGLPSVLSALASPAGGRGVTSPLPLQSAPSSSADVVKAIAALQTELGRKLDLIASKLPPGALP